MTLATKMPLVTGKLILSFHMNQVDGWSGINLKYCIAAGHDVTQQDC